TRLFADFAAATAFLTRIPAPRPVGHAGLLADAAWAFPLVGAGIGAVSALVFLLAQLLRLGDWPAALLAVLAGLALTGALHEDGLADTADGFLGGHDREQIGRASCRERVWRAVVAVSWKGIGVSEQCV